MAADALAHLRRPGIFTHGLTQSFDLVADGGPDNTWITQVGDAATFGSFAAFRAAVLAADPVQVTARPVGATGLPGGFDVRVGLARPRVR